MLKVSLRALMQEEEDRARARRAPPVKERSEVSVTLLLPTRITARATERKVPQTARQTVILHGDG